MNNDLIRDLFKMQGRQDMMLQVLVRKLCTKEEHDTLMEIIEKEVNETFKEETYDNN